MHLSFLNLHIRVAEVSWCFYCYCLIFWWLGTFSSLRIYIEISLSAAICAVHQYLQGFLRISQLFLSLYFFRIPAAVLWDGILFAPLKSRICLLGSQLFLTLWSLSEFVYKIISGRCSQSSSDLERNTSLNKRSEVNSPEILHPHFKTKRSHSNVADIYRALWISKLDVIRAFYNIIFFIQSLSFSLSLQIYLHISADRWIQNRECKKRDCLYNIYLHCNY